MPTQNKQEEIEIVKAVLLHPAGFNVDLFGGALCIRITDQNTVEVEWEDLGSPLPSGMRPCGCRSFPLFELDQAVTFFVDQRHEKQLGLDFEEEVLHGR